MDSDEGKLFVGGISWETTEEKLKDHFGGYGLVSQAVIMRDKATGRPRGFGFVIFADPSDIDRVLQDRHTIDGRTVEAKRAMSREEQQASKTTNPNSGSRNSNSSTGPNIRTKKIFVGGLPPSITDEGFKAYFEAYGSVTDIVIMIDQNTGRPRGFGFVTFDSEEAVDRVLHKTFHDLNGKSVEVKRALPRDASLNSGGGGGGGGGRMTGGAGGGGGLYQSSTGNPNSNMGGYDTRGDSNRYMQAQQTGYGTTQYGSGYGTGYGYGTGNTGTGYGGYGYGTMPGVQAVPAGTARAAWNSQPQSGYGSGAYGSNTGYNAGWNAGTGGTGPVPTGQSAGTGYGYGYGTEQSTGGYGGYQSGNQSGGFNGGYGGAYGGAQQRPAQ
ncbi:hypothetical protein LUZ60_014959 [Juncus effusus]|nr:hypothetical protein LUZ60_014959 [Juncus effusus]